MTRSYESLSAELRQGWSDDDRRVHEAVSREFAAEVAARRAVGAAVARARKASGLTQVELAQAASVQQAEVSRIERGHANPTVSTLARIAAATGSRLDLVAMGESSVWGAVPQCVEQALSGTFGVTPGRMSDPTDSITYQVEVTMSESLLEQMLADALEAERLRVEARTKLVGAVRRGAAAGMSQREIARAVNRSQPEVARLLRFFPSSERGRSLAKRRREVIELADQHGFRNVRVFGSVARGEDGPDSDIDLLVTFPRGASLFDIGALEGELAALLGERVDLVPDTGLRPHSRDEILAEAVPL